MNWLNKKKKKKKKKQQLRELWTLTAIELGLATNERVTADGKQWQGSGKAVDRLVLLLLSARCDADNSIQQRAKLGTGANKRTAANKQKQQRRQENGTRKKPACLPRTKTGAKLKIINYRHDDSVAAAHWSDPKPPDHQQLKSIEKYLMNYVRIALRIGQMLGLSCWRFLADGFPSRVVVHFMQIRPSIENSINSYIYYIFIDI